MDHALRGSIRRTLTVAVVIAALGAGWVLHGVDGAATHGAAAAHRPTKLTASDLLLAASTATAGIYLQYDGITGPPGTTFTKDAPISSFSFGVQRSPQTSGSLRVGSAPNLSDVSITHTFDKFSAPLFQASLTGNGSGNAILYFTDLNTHGIAVKYLELDFSQALLTSYQVSGSSGQHPNESLSINFTGITMIAHITGSPVQTVTYP